MIDNILSWLGFKLTRRERGPFEGTYIYKVTYTNAYGESVPFTQGETFAPHQHDLTLSIDTKNLPKGTLGLNCYAGGRPRYPKYGLFWALIRLLAPNTELLTGLRFRLLS